MTDISGNWDINTNGTTGELRIVPPIDPNNLQVSVAFSGFDRVDPWTGTWDDVAKELRLERVLPGNITQSYVGFLGDNDPSNQILAGSFTESDVTSGRTNFGWFAQNQRSIL